jgi:S-formylglutathione hydrolase
MSTGSISKFAMRVRAAGPFWETAMKRHGYLIVLGALASQPFALAALAQHGRIATDTVHAASLANLLGAPMETRVSVYLPPHYDSSDKRYPVVYLLHGFGVSDLNWVHPSRVTGLVGIMDELIATRAAKEMIVVMPNASTKFGGSFYVNSVTEGNWEDFIARDLVTWIDTKYRTLARPESRGITGHSMGGYGALYLGMRHGGATYGAMFAMNPCCSAPLEFLAARDADNWSTLAQTSSFAALAGTSYGVQGLAAISAAFAPDSARPPLYFALAEEKHGDVWTATPAVVSRFDDHAPLLMVPRYEANLRRMRAVGFEGNMQDEIVPTLDLMRLDTAMTRAGVTHTFALFEGTHVSRMGAQLLHVFPFFSRALVFDTAEK